MKKPGPPPVQPPGARTPTRSARSLTDTDTALWRHAASSLKPLKKAKPRVHAALETAPVTAKAEPNLKRGAAAHRPAPVAAAKTPPVAPPASTTRKPPPLSDFDTKRVRKLRSGQVEIDARIDLHGMRQSEAHVALRAFLHASHRRGHRVVLVITGKGAPAGVRRDDHWTESMGRSDRGILRRNVPMWLADPELRSVVVSYTEAGIRHGGDGALYVHLRRLR